MGRCVRPLGVAMPSLVPLFVMDTGPHWRVLAKGSWRSHLSSRSGPPNPPCTLYQLFIRTRGPSLAHWHNRLEDTGIGWEGLGPGALTLCSHFLFAPPPHHPPTSTLHPPRAALRHFLKLPLLV
jgi:hypothetical protein